LAAHPVREDYQGPCSTSTLFLSVDDLISSPTAHRLSSRHPLPALHPSSTPLSTNISLSTWPYHFLLYSQEEASCWQFKAPLPAVFSAPTSQALTLHPHVLFFLSLHEDWKVLHSLLQSIHAVCTSRSPVCSLNIGTCLLPHGGADPAQMKVIHNSQRVKSNGCFAFLPCLI
jgi:hypothetical protein